VRALRECGAVVQQVSATRRQECSWRQVRAARRLRHQHGWREGLYLPSMFRLAREFFGSIGSALVRPFLVRGLILPPGSVSHPPTDLTAHPGASACFTPLRGSKALSQRQYSATRSSPLSRRTTALPARLSAVAFAAVADCSRPQRQRGGEIALVFAIICKPANTGPIMV